MTDPIVRRAARLRAALVARRARGAGRRGGGEGTLAPENLWRLAMASCLVGDEEGFVQALREAHRGHLEAGDAGAPVRRAFWLGLTPKPTVPTVTATAMPSVETETV